MSTPPPPPPGNQPPYPSQPQYGGPPPGYSPYGAAAAPQGNSGMAIAGFVCSLVGLIPCFWVFQLPGLLGTIFGFIGLKQTKEGKKGRGMAIAAIVIGIILVVAAIAFAIFLATSDDCRTINGRFECNFD